MSITRRAAIVAAISGAMLASSSAFAQGLMVNDALGRSVVIKGPVNRVIATFNYEEFTAVAGLDGWKKVVAMSRAPWEGWRPAIFSRYAKIIPNLQAMPDVGHIEDNSFSAEKVIASKPDVMLMSEWGLQTFWRLSPAWLKAATLKPGLKLWRRDNGELPCRALEEAGTPTVQAEGSPNHRRI